MANRTRALVLKHKVSHSISQPVKQITPLSKQHRLLVATDAELLIVDWTKAEIATHYRSEQSLGTILELDATGRWLLTTLSDDTIPIWNMALKQPTKRETNWMMVMTPYASPRLIPTGNGQLLPPEWTCLADSAA